MLKENEMFKYENLRYEVLAYWHFCNELGPETTWREAWGELRTMHKGDTPNPGAYWYSTLNRREKAHVNAVLAEDMQAALLAGVKYRAPAGHARAREQMRVAAVKAKQG